MCREVCTKIQAFTILIYKFIVVVEISKTSGENSPTRFLSRYLYPLCNRKRLRLS